MRPTSVLSLLRRILFIAPLLFGLSPVVASLARADTSVPTVFVARLEGEVDPVTARHIHDVVTLAQKEKPVALIVTIDTPGGQDSSMRAIVQDLLNSAVPTVAFVWPSGSRDASAGVFITEATNVVAMAPGTNIGAAHPVNGDGSNIPSDMRDKITNDAAAYIASIAKQRGRNETWAEDAVRKSVSLDAKSAVDQHVADLMATDLNDLLRQLDGRTVVLPSGTTTLYTNGAVLNQIDMSPLAKALQAIIDPNIAYMLFTLGFYAILFEFYHPGALLPGFGGAICIILALVSFSALPLNWGGVLLVMVAIALFVVDVHASAHGVLTVAGIICFVVGSLMFYTPLGVVSPAAPVVSVALPIIITIGLAGAALATLLVTAAIKIHRRGPVTGAQLLIGQTGVASSPLDPVGTVQVNGVLWSARVHGPPLASGQAVRVVARTGLTLDVEPAASNRR
jgi:membrane-bound serine protease (ClpP class)